MTIVGTRMVSDGKTARQIFDEVMANPARTKFGFGSKLAIVNIDFQNAYTRIDEFKTAYEADPAPDRAMSTRISALARAKGMPVIWTHVAYMDDASDAGVWGTRTDTPDSCRTSNTARDRHAFDERCEIDRDGRRDLHQAHALALLRDAAAEPAGLAQGRYGGDHRRLDLGLRARRRRWTALSRGYRTIVPLETCADKHESYHFANLTDLQLKYADVEPVQTVIDWLEAR